MGDHRKLRALAGDWEALGDADPLFGVLSDPTKFGGKWDPDEFFASGRAHVADLFRTLVDARAGFEPGACLDFGCGVGRLTVPLSEVFRHTVGVDVARSMVKKARSYAPPDARCEFVRNRAPDLRRFPGGAFDLVHSCLVLQHIPPEISLGYIQEFFRVCKPGGLVVFQVPAIRWTETELSASHALSDAALSAAIVPVDPPDTVEASTRIVLGLRVTNRSSVTWPSDIPAGRHICVGNHWLLPDGTRVVDDDGRARLPRPVEPGQTIEMSLAVRAPEADGRYLLELDLVQEHVCWFSRKGSSTTRVEFRVTGARPPTTVITSARSPESGQAPTPAIPRPSLFTRLRRVVRKTTPTFEMHVIPRADVEDTIRSSGGVLIRAVDDNAAGPGWQSYTYICRKPAPAEKWKTTGQRGAVE